MRRPPSILNRILALHLVAFIGISAAIAAVAFLLLSATVERFEEQMLRAHALNISRYLNHANGKWTLSLPPDLERIYRKNSGSFALDVTPEDGLPLFSSFPQGAGAAHTSDPTPHFFNRTAGNTKFYLFLYPVRLNGHTAWVQVGQNLANPDVIVDDIVARFVGQIFWIILPILAVVFAIDVVLLRRQFQPMLATSQAATNMRPDSSLIRLPVQGLPREVLPLADAANQALERLEEALRAQREFTADAAHELRTPLTILRTEVEISLKGEAAQRLLTDIDAMTHVLDQLLELAELEGELPANKTIVDLSELAADVVSQMAPLALMHGKDIAMEGGQTPVPVRGNYHMLFRALRNLVENAIRHTPKGSQVSVDVIAPGTLSVADRGPGIPVSDRALVFQRFWRRERDSRDNAGLGLAIVAKIAQLHGGEVTILDNAGGGARISVILSTIDSSVSHAS
jgi:signal transduction histidine kinase